jgi:hypothetical protein
MTPVLVRSLVLTLTRPALAVPPAAEVRDSAAGALAIRHRLDPDIAAGRAAADVLIPFIVDYLTSPERPPA